MFKMFRSLMTLSTFVGMAIVVIIGAVIIGAIIKLLSVLSGLIIPGIIGLIIILIAIKIID
jgi:hypothetical protein